MEAPATDRQNRITGFSQETVEKSKINIIGCGGLGGQISEGLIRKAYGTVNLFDADTVELSNLNRQKFHEKDLYKNKAVQLAKNILKEGIGSTRIGAYPFTFQEAVCINSYDISCDVAVCGVDNNETRAYVAQYYHTFGIPVVFTAVNEQGNAGYVFVQEPGKGCFGCFRPDAIDDKKSPCPGTPAIIDILKVVAGIVLYAVDSLLMDRLRVWNYREVFLDGTIPEFCTVIEKRNGCKLCG